MAREAGTIDCLVFLESKDQIEKMLVRLDKIDNTEHIVCQLKFVYQQIDGLHEWKKLSLKRLMDY